MYGLKIVIHIFMCIILHTHEYDRYGNGYDTDVYDFCVLCIRKLGFFGGKKMK